MCETIRWKRECTRAPFNGGYNGIRFDSEAGSRGARPILSFMPNGNVHACTYTHRDAARGSVRKLLIERSFLQTSSKIPLLLRFSLPV